MEPAAYSPQTDSYTMGNVSSFGAPQDSTVSDADSQWNRNEVNLTRLERDFFLPRNVLPDRPKSVYFRTIMSVWSLRMCWSLLGELVKMIVTLSVFNLND